MGYGHCPVSDQCEHISMALYSIFGPCLGPCPILVQCQCTICEEPLDMARTFFHWQIQRFNVGTGFFHKRLNSLIAPYS